MARRHAIHIVGGIALGAFVTASLSYLSARWNAAIVFSDVRATVTLSTHNSGDWLGVQYHVVRGESCPSWSQHVIYRDNPVRGGIQRNFVPLAITSNGLGATPREHDFALSFRLPPDLQPGVWNYTVVTSSSCEWLPGLQRASVTQTPPVAIDIKHVTR